ncbi:MAG: hypothetical protein A2494_01785 [Candidatus Lloydbacteria bacterium RIFOXYC12_FULL_46_25]|uniref:DUF4177 domain-containing protein n=1 Tax=Candidatus Lloydbacteria bacterium RIFOXYC12_FULL_46_25 TaxID=1798670 RepID=A0A1G2E1C0_9BACT|nr:MAG: hypothetical protein A2494_01785 [Candidatus Lloydbacteria bacterium RIFOXYC12_FULL_46_25]
MKKFKYNLQFLSSTNIEETLATLGYQGWEIASVVSHEAVTLKNGRREFPYTVFLKQEIHDE